MKLLKGGAHLAVSGVVDVGDNGEFLVQCPVTGIVHLLRKRRSSSRECYYVTDQYSTIGQDEIRHAIFQYYGDGHRRVHFNDAQIDWSIRAGNFTIERV